MQVVRLDKLVCESNRVRQWTESNFWRWCSECWETVTYSSAIRVRRQRRRPSQWLEVRRRPAGTPLTELSHADALTWPLPALTHSGALTQMAVTSELPCLTASILRLILGKSWGLVFSSCSLSNVRLCRCSWWRVLWELNVCQLLKSTLPHEFKISVASRSSGIRWMHSGNDCYFAVLILSLSCPLYRMMIMMYKTIFMRVIEYWFEIWFHSVREEQKLTTCSGKY